jgi:hypothetical protein
MLETDKMKTVSLFINPSRSKGYIGQKNNCRLSKLMGELILSGGVLECWYLCRVVPWSLYSEVMHSCDQSPMGRRMYSINTVFRIVNSFRFPYNTKKFIPNLKSQKLYSEVMYSCDQSRMGRRMYGINTVFGIVNCFRIPYYTNKFIPNLKSPNLYSEVMHSCDQSHMGRRMYSINNILELSTVLEFPITQRSSFRFFSTEIVFRSCA